MINLTTAPDWYLKRIRARYALITLVLSKRGIPVIRKHTQDTKDKISASCKKINMTRKGCKRHNPENYTNA